MIINIHLPSLLLFYFGIIFRITIETLKLLEKYNICYNKYLLHVLHSNKNMYI